MKESKLKVCVSAASANLEYVIKQRRNEEKYEIHHIYRTLLQLRRLYAQMH